MKTLYKSLFLASVILMSSLSHAQFGGIGGALGGGGGNSSGGDALKLQGELILGMSIAMNSFLSIAPTSCSSGALRWASSGPAQRCRPPRLPALASPPPRRTSRPPGSSTASAQTWSPAACCTRPPRPPRGGAPARPPLPPTHRSLPPGSSAGVPPRAAPGGA